MKHLFGKARGNAQEMVKERQERQLSSAELDYKLDEILRSLLGQCLVHMKCSINICWMISKWMNSVAHNQRGNHLEGMREGTRSYMTVCCSIVCKRQAPEKYSKWAVGQEEGPLGEGDAWAGLRGFDRHFFTWGTRATRIGVFTCSCSVTNRKIIHYNSLILN